MNPRPLLLAPGSRRPTLARLASLLALVAVAVLALPALAADPASAADNGQYGVNPTPLPGAAPNQVPRPFFQPSLTPGATVADSVTITNKTAGPLSFTLYPADAFNTDTGGFSLRPQHETQTDMGTWIRLSQQQVTVEPSSSLDVPFTIVVPADAEPGDHVGGIVAESDQATFEQQGDVGVGAVQAVGTRVYGRVEGPLMPSLAITDLQLATDGSGLTGGEVSATVSFSVTNTGNVRLTPGANASLSPMFGSPIELPGVNIPDLLPGGKATITYPATAVRPLGKLTANVRVQSDATQVSGSTSQWLIPWLLALALVVIVVALVVLRRRRRSPAEAPPPPTGRTKVAAGEAAS